MADISVVIATYNRMELLPRTLPALANQRTGGFEYEVIFVDDGSTDGSRDIIETEVRRNPGRMRYQGLPHFGSPSHPRNVGVREASGRIVLFLDDDVIPDPDLVWNHWQFHQRNPGGELAALGELFLPEDAKRDPMSIFHSFPYEEVRHKPKLDYLFFWTCNISLKREFMLENGMFDEEPALHPLEDMECGYRLFARGLRLEFLPQARGAHVHKMNPAGVPQKGQRTGRAQFALACKVPDVSFKRRFKILSRDLGPRARFSRILRRALGRVVDNPLALATLRGLGAERSERNRITDLYYFLIFRRNVVAGYESAEREGRRSCDDAVAQGEGS
jgi:glycosyltransferase involved in cell wall biosynthesis